MLSAHIIWTATLSRWPIGLAAQSAQSVLSAYIISPCDAFATGLLGTDYTATTSRAAFGLARPRSFSWCVRRSRARFRRGKFARGSLVWRRCAAQSGLARIRRPIGLAATTAQSTLSLSARYFETATLSRWLFGSAATTARSLLTAHVILKRRRFARSSVDWRQSAAQSVLSVHFGKRLQSTLSVHGIRNGDTICV